MENFIFCAVQIKPFLAYVPILYITWKDYKTFDFLVF